MSSLQNSQIGSFVPADAATFKMVNRIFSRVGNGDKIEDSASSFALEVGQRLDYLMEGLMIEKSHACNILLLSTCFILCFILDERNELHFG